MYTLYSECSGSIDLFFSESKYILTWQLQHADYADNNTLSYANTNFRTVRLYLEREAEKICLVVFNKLHESQSRHISGYNIKMRVRSVITST